MKAEPVATLGGWKVEIRTGIVPPFSLSPDEAEAFAEQLRAAAQHARREATMEAGLPLADRVLARLRASGWCTARKLAKLLGEREGAVAEALEQLRGDGRACLRPGMAGFYVATGRSS